MIKTNLLIIFALCACTVYPATSISRWFSSSYHDMRVTLRRYGHCVSDLPPLRDQSLNETDYLIQTMRGFLDQANYDPDQLSNISALMDNICRLETNPVESSYAISVNIDVNKYSNNGTGKDNRCRAIDEALDAMYHVFKRAALNKSEPLDFSVVQFYPNPANKAASYNLTDLINTSWIKSETILEHVCKITDSVKEYVHARSSNSSAQDRASKDQPAASGVFSTLLDLINRLLDPIFGLQKRLYWESNNRFEIGYSRLSSGLSSLRDGIGSRVKSTRSRIAGLFSSTNSTTNAATSHNSSLSSPTRVPNTHNNYVPKQPMSPTVSPAAPVALNKTVSRK